MLIKMFKNGQGRGAGPVRYLVAREVVAYSENRDVLRDERGKIAMVERHPLPEVLRGDPARTEALIDATPHRWSYRAGVISFAPEDAPTGRQQIEVMDAFERLAFAGLEPDQRDILWVRHTHEGRVELHFATPRMELATGRSFNIAPPGYENAFDALRDVLNKEHGWADPEDPSRARDVTSLIEHTRRGEAREVIHDWLLDRIAEGEIHNRADMVRSLTEAGFEVPRAGKDYITALDPETGERFRLRGDIFHEDWTRAATLERAAERRTAERGGPGDGIGKDGGIKGRSGGETSRLDHLDGDQLRSRLRSFECARAAYNRGRYARHDVRDPQGHERIDGIDRGGFEPDAQAFGLGAADDRGFDDRLDRDELRRRLVMDGRHDVERQIERPPGGGDRDPSVTERDAVRDRSDQVERVGLSHSGPSRDLSHAHPSDRALSEASPARLRPSPDAEVRAHDKEPPHARYTPNRPEPGAGRGAPDRPGAGVAQLRHSADASLGGLSGAVRSLGAALDRADERAAGRAGELRQLATEVSNYVDQRVRQIGLRFGWLLDLAVGMVRYGGEPDAGRQPPEHAPPLRASSDRDTSEEQSRSHERGASRSR